MQSELERLAESLVEIACVVNDEKSLQIYTKLEFIKTVMHIILILKQLKLLM